MSRGGEAALQAHVVKLLRHLGCQVFVTSQNRVSHVTSGIPDLYVLHQAFGGAWVEVKAPDGILSPAQLDFQAACKQCDVHHRVVRTEADIEMFLRAQGLWL